MSNTFWLNNPNVLINKDKLKDFFPNKNQTIPENLNSIVRLSVYLTLGLLLYSKNLKYILLPLIVLLLTYGLFVMYPEKEDLINMSLKEISLDKPMKKCIKPTVDNPFMNYNHITDDYHRPPACRAFLNNDKKSLKIRKKVEKCFNEKLYRDVSDLYSKRNGQREFYTIAYNQVPDQTSFAKWLYKTGPTCKERGLNCAPHTGTMI